MIRTVAIAAAVAGLAVPAQAAQVTAEDAAAAAVMALGAAAFETVTKSADASVIAPLTAAIAPPVPEPKSWAMMILGFGFVGVMVRRRRLVSAA